MVRVAALVVWFAILGGGVHAAEDRLTVDRYGEWIWPDPPEEIEGNPFECLKWRERLKREYYDRIYAEIDAENAARRRAANRPAIPDRSTPTAPPRSNRPTPTRRITFTVSIEWR